MTCGGPVVSVRTTCIWSYLNSLKACSLAKLPQILGIWNCSQTFLHIQIYWPGRDITGRGWNVNPYSSYTIYVFCNIMYSSIGNWEIIVTLNYLQSSYFVTNWTVKFTNISLLYNNQNVLLLLQRGGENTKENKYVTIGLYIKKTHVNAHKLCGKRTGNQFFFFPQR